MNVSAFWVLIGFVFIIGLCIGSFLNVVILRALSNESIVFPASKCPVCGNKLKWWHNIPVLSYILLGGKCGFCKCRISIQYPIIEILTGILFTIAFIKFFVASALLTGGISLGNYIDTVYSWVVISLLIVMAVTDIKEKVVFDAHTYSLIGAGLVYAILITGFAVYFSVAATGKLPLNTSFLLNNPLTDAILGIAAGTIIMELLARSGYLFVGSRAFGEGDTYIAAGIGAVFGWKKLIMALILSIIIQLIITLPLFLKKLFDNKNYITFGTLSGFFIYAAIFLLLQSKGMLSNSTVYIIAAVILALIGITACVNIIKGIKNNPENMIYLPFGPAMAIASLLMICL